MSFPPPPPPRAPPAAPRGGTIINPAQQQQQQQQPRHAFAAPPPQQPQQQPRSSTFAAAPPPQPVLQNFPTSPPPPAAMNAPHPSGNGSSNRHSALLGKLLPPQNPQQQQQQQPSHHHPKQNGWATPGGAAAAAAHYQQQQQPNGTTGAGGGRFGAAPPAFHPPHGGGGGGFRGAGGGAGAPPPPPPPPMATNGGGGGGRTTTTANRTIPSPPAPPPNFNHNNGMMMMGQHAPPPPPNFNPNANQSSQYQYHSSSNQSIGSSAGSQQQPQPPRTMMTGGAPPPPPPPNFMQQQQQQQPLRGAPPPPPVGGMQPPPPPPQPGTVFPPQPPPPPRYQDMNQNQNQNYTVHANSSMVDSHIQPGSSAAVRYPTTTTTTQHPPPQQHMDGSSRRGGYPHAAPAEKPKIDPSQIPRPPLFTRPQQQPPQDSNVNNNPLPVYYPKQQGAPVAVQIQPPPPADSRYAVVDDGNASPDCLRSSTYAFPLDRSVWHQAGDVPLGILCTPLQVPSQDFVPRPRRRALRDGGGGGDGGGALYRHPQAIAVVPGADAPPARCRHCNAYVNPYTDPGTGTCNLCRTRNNAPNLVGMARQLATIEYGVGGPYVTRSSGVETATTLYALDLTLPALMNATARDPNNHSSSSSSSNPYIDILSQLAADLHAHWNRQQPYQMVAPNDKPVPRIGVCLFGAVGCVVRCRRTHRYRVMADVTEQPFAAVPLSEWTHSVATEGELADFQQWLARELAPDVAHWRERNARHRAAGGADGLELSCGGAALQFLHASLAASGGRGCVITWRRPNYGAGALPHRSPPGRRNAAVEDTAAYLPLQTSSTATSAAATAAAFYKQLETACVQSRVTLDFVLHTASRHQFQQHQQQPPLELATLGEFCKITSGNLIWINQPDHWQETLLAELTRPLQSFVGWDAVFKVRVSEGVEVKRFYTSSGIQVEASVLSGGSPELELSSVTPSTCIALELEHRVGGIPRDRGLVFVQTALLYTTYAGRRRVRVSTLALRTTTVVNEVYRAVDFGALTTLLTRSVTDCFRQTNGNNDSAEIGFGSGGGTTDLRLKARDLIYHRCIHILASYRQHTPAKNSPLGQLILPEKMQLLPLFAMCLLKSPLLRPALPRRAASAEAAVLSPTADERAYYLYHLSQVLPCFTMLLVHPNVFAVVPGSNSVSNGFSPEEEDERVGQWICNPEDQGEGTANGFVVMPPSILPSMESLEDDGVYLIDDGTRIFLYIGKDAPEHIKQALMWNDDNENNDNLSEDAVAVKQRVEALVFQMRQYSSTTRGSESELRRTVAPVIRVLQQEGHQSPAEADILNLMVADATAGEKDYVDYLCTLHRRIREKVERGGK